MDVTGIWDLDGDGISDAVVGEPYAYGAEKKSAFMGSFSKL